jgi:hypothetical protein
VGVEAAPDFTHAAHSELFCGLVAIDEEVAC